MHATTVVGVTVNAEQYHYTCWLNESIETGTLAPGARGMDPSDVLWQYHEYHMIDVGEDGYATPIFYSPNLESETCSLCGDSLLD